MMGTVLQPVGVELADVDISRVDDEAARQLRRLLADHGVIVFRDQDVDDEWFLRFLRHFGDPVFTVGETPVPGYPDLNVITNVGRTRPPRSVFHVDTSYVSRPPAYTALRAVTIPGHGGETLFSNQYRALDTLPMRLRRHLAGRTVAHVVTGVDPGDAQERFAEHPLFRPHPLSGRLSLYLSTPERCVAVSGLSEVEARQTIASLYAHSTAEDNVYRHRWQAGDVVMWDNGCVMHKADHSGVVGERVMHRGMVDGYAAMGATDTPTGHGYPAADAASDTGTGTGDIGPAAQPDATDAASPAAEI